MPNRALLSVCELPWLRVVLGRNSFALAIKDGIVVAAPEPQQKLVGRGAREVWITYRRRGAIVRREDPPSSRHAPNPIDREHDRILASVWSETS